MLLKIFDPLGNADTGWNSAKRTALNQFLYRLKATAGYKPQCRRALSAAPHHAPDVLSGMSRKKTRLQLMLEGRDGTGVTGESGLQVRDGLRRLLKVLRKFGQRAAFGRSALGNERGAEMALGVYETLPNDIGCRRAVTSL